MESLIYLTVYTILFGLALLFVVLFYLCWCAFGLLRLVKIGLKKAEGVLQLFVRYLCSLFDNTNGDL